MNEVYYFTPLHNKFIKFDDVTWLAIILLLFFAYHFISSFKVRVKR